MTQKPISSPWAASHTLSPDRVQELHQICNSMQVVSDNFYQGATRTGNHAFIEFCGLMNEYIKACREAVAKGIDFTEANIHSGVKLPMRPHHLDYISEKFNCIYGNHFSIATLTNKDTTA